MKNYEDHVFTFNKSAWSNLLGKDYFLPEAPKLEEIENGVVLPMRPRKDITGFDIPQEGGVCRKDGTFVSGLCRDLNFPHGNRSCMKGYEIPGSVKIRHETVVFGGVIANHFGHLLTDSLSHLWWYADNPDTPYKLVFVVYDKKPLNKSVLELLGITDDRMEIITEATQFDKIIVPHESFYPLSHYRPGAEKVFDYMRTRVTPAPYKRVYLSRTKFESQDTVNEIYYEDFYRKRGYEIVYPETLSFKEQVAIMAGADEVVATHGTLVLLSGFCKPKTKVIILNRCKKTAGLFVILSMKKLDVYIIDAHLTFLPAQIGGSRNTFFFGPNIHWVEYLNKMNIPYEEDEVSIDKHVKPYIWDYITKWGQTYSQPVLPSIVRNLSIIDLIEDINNFLLNQSIDRKAYRDRDDIVKLQKENALLREKLKLIEGIISKEKV